MHIDCDKQVSSDQLKFVDFRTSAQIAGQQLDTALTLLRLSKEATNLRQILKMQPSVALHQIKMTRVK